jgi:hypothetical protein
MLQRGVMAAAGRQLILARHARALARPPAGPQRSASIRAAAVAVEAPAAAAPGAAPAFKAHLDFKFVRENLARVAENCKARNSNADPARVAALYDEFTRLKQESDSLRAARNENSAAMKVRAVAAGGGGPIEGARRAAGPAGPRAARRGRPSRRAPRRAALRRCAPPASRAPPATRAPGRAGGAPSPLTQHAGLAPSPPAAIAMGSSPAPRPRSPTPPGPQQHKTQQGKLEPDARAALIAKGQALKTELEALEASLSTVEASLQAEGQRLPNLTHPDVPLGGEEHAAVLRTVGAPRDFGFTPKDHVTLGEALGLLDFEAGAEVSGSKFYYLKNAAALLELALVNYAMTKV